MSKLPVVGASPPPDWIAEGLLALDGAVEQLVRAQAAMVHEPTLAAPLAEAETLLSSLAALRSRLRDRALARFGAR